MVNIPGAFHPAISGTDFLKEIPMSLFHPMEYGINIVFLKRSICKCLISFSSLCGFLKRDTYVHV